MNTELKPEEENYVSKVTEPDVDNKRGNMSDKMMDKRKGMPDYAPATETHADGGRLNNESGSMNNPMPFFMPTEEYNYSFLNSFMKYGLGATPWG